MHSPRALLVVAVLGMVFLSPLLCPSSGRGSDLDELERGVRLVEKESFREAVKLFQTLSIKTPTKPEVWYYLGLAESRLQQWDPAINHLRKARSLDSSSPAIGYQLALALHSVGRIDDARPILQAILDVDDNFPQALFLMASILGQGGDREQEIKLLTRAVGQDPDFLEARINLAQALMDAGRLDQARAEAEQALGRRSDSQAAINTLAAILEKQGKGDDASVLLRRLAEQNPEDPEPMLALGDYYFKQGLFDAAVEAYKTGCGLGEPSARCFFNLGAALQHLERWDEAGQAFKQASELTPEDGEALFQLAQSLSQAGQGPAAAEVYEKLLKLDPENRDALYNLSLELERQGKLDKAGALLERLSRLEPDDPSTQVRQGLLKERAGDLAGAAGCYKRALELTPDDLDALLALALVNHRLGRTSDALEMYRKLMDSRPDDARVFYGAGLLLRAGGDGPGAREALHKAVELAPTMVDAWLELGRVEDEASNWKDAEQAYSQAALLGCSGPEVQYALGRVQFKQARYEDAVSSLTPAVALEPGRPEARYFLGMSLLELEKRNEGLFQLQEAARLAPDNLELVLELALALSRDGRCAEALPHYQKVEAGADARLQDAARQSRLRCLGEIGDPDSLGELVSGKGPLESPLARKAAGALFERRDYEAVIKVLSRTTPEPEDEFAVEFMLGFSLHKLDRNKEALPRLERAAALDSGHYETLRTLAVVLDRLGKREEATRMLERAAAADPEKGAGDRKILGKVYLQGGNQASALKELEAAYAADPADLAGGLLLGKTLESTGKQERALKIYDSLIKLHPRSGELFFRRGRIHLKKNSLGPAVSDLRKAGELGVDEPGFHQAYGVALARKGDHLAAAREFERLVSLKPGDKEGTVNLARSLLAGGKAEQALKVALKQWEGDKSDSQVLYLVVRCAQTLGRHQDVVRYGREFARLFPGEKPEVVRAAASAALTAGDQEGAIALLTDLVKADPRDGETWETLGRLHLERNSPDKARECFEAALAAAPERGRALLGMGMVLDRLGQGDEAATYLRRSLKVLPGDPEPLYNLAVVLSKTESNGEVIPLLEKCIAVDKTFAPCYHGLAFIHLSLGNKSEARKLLKILEKLDSELAKELRREID